MGYVSYNIYDWTVFSLPQVQYVRHRVTKRQRREWGSHQSLFSEDNFIFSEDEIACVYTETDMVVRAALFAGFVEAK